MTDLEIIRLGKKVLQGASITYEEAMRLQSVKTEDIPLLAAYANKIRHTYAGTTVEMCGIINARSGLCSEDCKFCSQSVYHQTQAPVFPLRQSDDLIAEAKKVAAHGVQRLSLVTSGKGMENDLDFPGLINRIAVLKETTGLSVCANLGTLRPDQAALLAAAGVRRYAHNLETSRSYYAKICSTHPYEDRLHTLKAAKAAGMELCSGGIIGMGETWQDRVELAFTLRSLEVDSVPVNILNPIKGTALEEMNPRIQPLEIIKTLALFRFILPDKVIRPAGGREINLRDLQGTAMLAGANGLIVGHYLTFSGRDTTMDYTMVRDAGLEPV
ncbi:radical sam [Lucifera butyrica]|uniref:Biotin synthase n=1 Tax=Lucifera butyrica TaxID=1351585 RepID=A0A498R2F9_9FIRM|nr:biotin synthase BioB [Lucifera butyrica]VBB06816.1 radical sam [Lucifera butyrica]